MSVLIALYNGSRFIVEQVESILAQVSTEDEVIILDDCSPDDSYVIAKAMEARHPHLKVFQNEENLGVIKTFEALLTLATKDIIFLSDQDDIWVEGRKAKMIEAMGECGGVAVLANSTIYVDGECTHDFFADGYRPGTNSIMGNFLKNNFIGCCMAFRRDILTLALPFPGSISMHDWWLGSCAMATGRVAYSDKPALLYRRHTANLSPSKRRRWLPVAKDRIGNLVALASLLKRVTMLKLLRKLGRHA